MNVIYVDNETECFGDDIFDYLGNVLIRVCFMTAHRYQCIFRLHGVVYASRLMHAWET